MRTKSVVGFVLLVLGGVFLPGCNNTPPKEGVRIQPGDYAHEPGWHPGGPDGASHAVPGAVAKTGTSGSAGN